MSGGYRTHDRCPMAPRGCGRRSRRPQGVGSSGVKCIPRPANTAVAVRAGARLWPQPLVLSQGCLAPFCGRACFCVVIILGTWENGRNYLGGSMSVELIGIMAVGVALAGVILTSSRGLRQDMRRLDGRISAASTRRSRLVGLPGPVSLRRSHPCCKKSEVRVWKRD